MAHACCNNGTRMLQIPKHMLQISKHMRQISKHMFQSSKHMFQISKHMLQKCKDMCQVSKHMFQRVSRSMAATLCPSFLDAPSPAKGPVHLEPIVHEVFKHRRQGLSDVAHLCGLALQFWESAARILDHARLHDTVLVLDPHLL